MDMIDSIIRLAILITPALAIIFSLSLKPYQFKLTLNMAALGLLISTILAIPIGAFLQRQICLVVETSCEGQPGMLIPLAYSIIFSLVSIFLVLLVRFIKTRLNKKC